MPEARATALWSATRTDHAGWTSNAAAGCRAALALDRDATGSALRLDFALAGHGAWAIARCDAAIVLPEHFVLQLALRGDADPAELQVKLVDRDDQNVWWWRTPDFVPARTSERRALRRASLRFAWGPKSGGDPRELAAVELALASDRAAAGTLWLEELCIEPREPVTGPPRIASWRASSATEREALPRAGVAGEGASTPRTATGVADGGAVTHWRARSGDARPWIELDLGGVREWGGLVLEWAEGTPPGRCRVLGSNDGVAWQSLLEETPARARAWLRTGEAESRFVRLELDDANAASIARLAVVPIELAVSPVRFAGACARGAARGRLPRHLLGEHASWAVIGLEGDGSKALLGEDGAVEVGEESFTLEPFLRVGERTLSWADVESAPSLVDGTLPIPSVRWIAGDLRLDVTAFAIGEPGRSALALRHRVENAGATHADVRLRVAIRPFQVTPEWQSLNLSPAIAPISRLARAPDGVRVNEARRVVSVRAPDAVRAARPSAGLGAFLDDDTTELEVLDDPLGFAECALDFALSVAPGACEDVVLAVPCCDDPPALPHGLSRDDASAWAEARRGEAIARWRERLSHVPLVLPPAAGALADTLRASLGWILVQRDGPRIQPGSRCYRRSWIRDGAITGTALAEMGLADAALAFFRWYAPFQLPDGRVPCAVDRRGLDHAVEHDSHGELVWGVVELWRLTGDDAFLRELWPNVLRAVEAIAALCDTRRGPDFAGDARFGLLPESISHEGYASQPVHSYWDDLFALRALGDACDAAGALGDRAAQARAGALRDTLRRDLHASLAATMAHHGIDFVPGSVELGDFDPTSTAIAFDPCNEDARLPREALERTFARYGRELEERRSGVRAADAYTAYEVRTAVALMRLGQRERALDLLEWLVSDQRPPAWRQWPEVSTRDPRAPRFLGDLPHGWIASTFVRALRRLVVDERPDDGVLVIGAGLPEAWLRDPAGVRARALPTRYGPLDLALAIGADDLLHARFGGECHPPGGIELVSPFARAPRTLHVDGEAHLLLSSLAVRDGISHACLRERPREVVLG